MKHPEVRALFDSNTWTLTYVVFDPKTRDAVLIDPVLDYDPLASQTKTDAIDRIEAVLREENLHLTAVLETHAHADHLSAAAYFGKHHDVPVAIGRGITKVQAAFAKIFDIEEEVKTDGSQFDQLLDPGKTYSFGSLNVATLSTPGHTPACMSYLIGDAVFTGDALFMPDYGTGRTDFPAGSADDLYSSVHDTLYALPGETRVFVGHDYQPGGRPVAWESSISEQRSANVQLRAETTREDFVAFRKERDRSLSAPRLIYQSIQINVYGGFLPSEESNGVRYLKIPLNMRQRTDEVGTPRERASRSSSNPFEGFPLRAGYYDIPAGGVDSIPERVRFIDVRQPEEFDGELGHLDRAELVPLTNLDQSAKSWAPDEPLLLICRSGNRSGHAAAALVQAGFSRVGNLKGGMLAVRSGGR